MIDIYLHQTDYILCVFDSTNRDSIQYVFCYFLVKKTALQPGAIHKLPKTEIRSYPVKNRPDPRNPNNKGRLQTGKLVIFLVGRLVLNEFISTQCQNQPRRGRNLYRCDSGFDRGQANRRQQVVGFQEGSHC
jgi:hypothetical protein